MQDQLISPPITQTLKGECDEIFKLEIINISEMEPGLLRQAWNIGNFPFLRTN